MCQYQFVAGSYNKTIIAGGGGSGFDQYDDSAILEEQCSPRLRLGS